MTCLQAPVGTGDLAGQFTLDLANSNTAYESRGCVHVMGTLALTEIGTIPGTPVLSLEV